MAEKTKKKRRKPVAGDARTIAACERLGWLAGKVERRLPMGVGHPGGTSIYLFGFVDIVAIPSFAPGVIFIQSTVGSNGNLQARIRKAVEQYPDRVRRILNARNRIEFWCWRKYARKTASGRKSKSKVWDAVRWTLGLDESNAIVSREVFRYSELLHIAR